MEYTTETSNTSSCYIYQYNPDTITFQELSEAILASNFFVDDILENGKEILEQIIYELSVGTCEIVSI